MPFNGSGVFQRVRNWVADATAGIKIRSDMHDSEDDGFAAGLTNCITKDGQTLITQNIPFNNKRITGLADPINPQDAATKASTTAAIAGAPVLPSSGGVITGDLTVNGSFGVYGSVNFVGPVSMGSTLTMSGTITTAGSIGDVNAGASNTGLIVLGGGAANDSYLVFHRPGQFAVNFGLSADGRLYVGGWSMGAGVKYKVLTTQDLDPTQLFAGIPVNPQSNYVTVATDAQKCIAGTGSITINSALYPVGTVLTFAGYGGSMVIACSGNAIYWIGPSGVVGGNRTLPDRGIATALRTPDGNWIIGGNGLT